MDHLQHRKKRGRTMLNFTTKMSYQIISDLDCISELGTYIKAEKRCIRQNMYLYFLSYKTTQDKVRWPDSTWLNFANI